MELGKVVSIYLAFGADKLVLPEASHGVLELALRETFGQVARNRIVQLANGHGLVGCGQLAHHDGLNSFVLFGALGFLFSAPVQFGSQFVTSFVQGLNGVVVDVVDDSGHGGFLHS